MYFYLKISVRVEGAESEASNKSFDFLLFSPVGVTPRVSELRKLLSLS